MAGHARIGGVIEGEGDGAGCAARMVGFGEYPNAGIGRAATRGDIGDEGVGTCNGIRAGNGVAVCVGDEDKLGGPSGRSEAGEGSGSCSTCAGYCTGNDRWGGHDLEG